MLNTKTVLNNKVIFNWDIHYSCNYRCSYCFFSGRWDSIKKENRYPDMKILINAWDNIYDRYGSCHIHFSGGEPFTYPNFLDLIEKLSKKHTLEFSTNLSFDVNSFSNIISSDKAKTDVTFHPEFINVDAFLEKALFLKTKGFNICVSYVAYPPNLNQMDEFQKRFEDSGIPFIIQVFRGEFEGRVYPDGYSEEEKAHLKISSAPSDVNKAIFDHRISNAQRQEGKSRLCYMGMRYVKIHPDGSAYRCCTPEVERIFNIIDDRDIKLLKEPKSCGIEKCHCYKAMIFGDEEKWAKSWEVELRSV